MRQKKETLDLLTSAERKAYDRRLLDSPTHGDPLPAEEKRRVSEVMWWAVGIFAGLIAIVLVVGAVMNGGFSVLWVTPALVFAGMSGIPLLGEVSRQASAAARRRYAAAYLVEIGYSERKPKPKRPAKLHDDSDDSPVFYTNGYDPDRWFGYSKGERDYMRDRGMPADVYDSNVRDHDPS